MHQFIITFFINLFCVGEVAFEFGDGFFIPGSEFKIDFFCTAGLINRITMQHCTQLFSQSFWQPDIFIIHNNTQYILMFVIRNIFCSSRVLDKLFGFSNFPFAYIDCSTNCLYSYKQGKMR